jgi:hypothetical protein
VFNRLNDFLGRYVLPLPVRFLTFRFVILITILLLIPLLLVAGHQALAPSIHSPLTTMSVAVSSIVLLYATLAEVHQKQVAKLQENSAQAVHEPITEMPNLMLQTLVNQWSKLKI